MKQPNEPVEQIVQTISIVNRFPNRYRTLEDAQKRVNPILFGRDGWEEAQFQECFVVTKP